MGIFKWVANQFDPAARVANAERKKFQKKIDFATNDLWERWREYTKKDWHTNYATVIAGEGKLNVPDKSDPEVQSIMLMAWTDVQLEDKVPQRSSQIPVPDIVDSLDALAIKPYFEARAREYWSKVPLGKEY